MPQHRRHWKSPEPPSTLFISNCSPWMMVELHGDSIPQCRWFCWCNKAASFLFIGDCLWMVTEVHYGGAHRFLFNADQYCLFRRPRKRIASSLLLVIATHDLRSMSTRGITTRKSNIHYSFTILFTRFSPSNPSSSHINKYHSFG